MHLPPGVLDGAPLLAAGAVATMAVGACAWTMRRAPHRIVPAVVGVIAVAAIHRMELPFGVGAHLLGGTLLAIALGPAAAIVVIAAALALEAVVFAPAELATLGVDALVQGVAGVVLGYGVYRGVLAVAERSRDRGDPWRAGASAAGAAAGVIAASVALIGVLAVLGGPTLDGGDIRALITTHVRLAGIEAAVTATLVAVGLGWRRWRRRALARAGVHRRAHVLDGDMDLLG